MTFKEFRRTAAKVTIWFIIFWMGAMFITIHLGIPDPAILKDQQYGLILGAFVGLMVSSLNMVFSFQNKKEQVKINDL